jgi:hypothetical protein
MTSCASRCAQHRRTSTAHAGPPCPPYHTLDRRARICLPAPRLPWLSLFSLFRSPFSLSRSFLSPIPQGPPQPLPCYPHSSLSSTGPLLAGLPRPPLPPTGGSNQHQTPQGAAGHRTQQGTANKQYPDGLERQAQRVGLGQQGTAGSTASGTTRRTQTGLGHQGTASGTARGIPTRRAGDRIPAFARRRLGCLHVWGHVSCVWLPRMLRVSGCISLGCRPSICPKILRSCSPARAAASSLFPSLPPSLSPIPAPPPFAPHHPPSPPSPLTTCSTPPSAGPARQLYVFSLLPDDGSDVRTQARPRRLVNTAPNPIIHRSPYTTEWKALLLRCADARPTGLGGPGGTRCLHARRRR